MMEGKTSCNGLPPGFRFHPTDEELIIYYLKNKAMSMPCPVAIIPEVNIYNYDPWQLPEKAEFGENEWYFFSPRDRKYPNGVRPNRATLSGYWKATGTDKAIYSGSKHVGVKKALVFYEGRPPRGTKTDWIMHEYRLTDFRGPTIKRNNGSMRLDDSVLCRIYKKKHAKTFDQNTEDSNAQAVEKSDGGHVDDQEILKFPRTVSLTHLLEMDYLTPISHILADHPYSNVAFDFPNTVGSSSDSASSRVQLGGEFQSNYAEWSKCPPNNNYTNNNSGSHQTQPLMNSIFDLQ